MGIHEKAIDIIAKRRQNARLTYEQHTEEAQRKIPELAEINHQLAGTALKLFNIITLGGEHFRDNFERLKRQNMEAQDMAAELLRNNGYPDDYLDIKYTCNICGDTGYNNGVYCQCFKELTSRLAVEALNAESHIKLTDFSNFNLDYYKNVRESENMENCYEHMRNVLQYCRQYAEGFTKNSKGIFMMGRTGLGKTHLSLAIAKTVAEKGYTVIYDSAGNLIRKIEKEHFRHSANANNDADTLELLLSADLLIMDDLGAEFSSSFYISTIYNIINTRLSRNIPTIINTNLTPKELEKQYDAKIVSRLFSFGFLKFYGNDIRNLRRAEKTQ